MLQINPLINDDVLISFEANPPKIAATFFYLHERDDTAIIRQLRRRPVLCDIVIKENLKKEK